MHQEEGASLQAQLFGPCHLSFPATFVRTFELHRILATNPFVSQALRDLLDAAKGDQGLRKKGGRAENGSAVTEV